MSQRQNDTNTSATALRAIRILELLGDAGKPMSVVEVGEGIGADRSTAYRMLMTLLGAGYVTRDASLKKYQLGHKLLSLSRSILNRDERNELIKQALGEIAEQTKETAHYCVLDRDATVLVLRAKGTQLVAVDFQIGSRSPLHCTSIGKLLLSYQEPARIEETIKRGLSRVAVNTITDPNRFRVELRKVKARGFAFDDREFHDDMRCLAVPVFEKDGAVLGGISMSGPSFRFTIAKLEELRAVASEIASGLSRKLGESG